MFLLKKSLFFQNRYLNYFAWSPIINFGHSFCVKYILKGYANYMSFIYLKLLFMENLMAQFLSYHPYCFYHIVVKNKKCDYMFCKHRFRKRVNC
jgi:hypothetical protein